ncbi:hypothetical protein ACFVVL_34075 [Kitasatospora sp. NPDC058115]|uniref:hypothetical protein n=1 Tax=Kitasatospora sp. NPDC058115 TaxID=3346347 RepID=UPI0036DAE238
MPTDAPYDWNLDEATAAVTTVGAYRKFAEQLKDNLLRNLAHPDIRRYIHCETDGQVFDDNPWFQFQGQLYVLRNLFTELTDLDAENSGSTQEVITSVADAVPAVTAQYRTTADALADVVAEVKKGELTQQTRDRLTTALRSLHDLLQPPQQWTEMKEEVAGRTADYRGLADRIVKVQEVFKADAEQEAERYEKLARRPEAACARKELLSYAADVRTAVKQVTDEQSEAVAGAVEHADGAGNSLARLIGSLGNFAGDYRTAAEEIANASTAETGSVVQRLDFASSRTIWEEYAEKVKELSRQPGS